MKKLIVVSGISPVVFHGTDRRSAYEICRTNKFAMNWSLAKQAEDELSTNKPYYFSTARNKNSNYIQDSSVIFKLDGRKLASKYKGQAVDYWGESFRRPGKSEQEDRIYGDKPYIENAANYIMEIYLILPDRHHTIQTKFIEGIQKFCKLKKIPLKFYENRRDMLLNKSPVIDFSIIKSDEKIRPPRSYNAIDLIQWLAYAKFLDKYVKTRKKGSDFWNDIDTVRELKPGRVKRLISYPRDLLPQFKADLHNSSNDKTPSAIKALDDLRRYMKYKKLKSPKEFVDHLITTRNEIQELEYNERKTTQEAAFLTSIEIGTLIRLGG